MLRRQLPLLLAAAALPAAAQPDALPPAIRLVVTFPPGGASDILARALAEALMAHAGTRIVVDNRPGAGGTMGAAHVATQPADGSVLMLSNTAPIVTSPPIYRSAGYDPAGGFSHIAYLGANPFVILAHPGRVPARTLPDLVAWIRAERQPPAYGTSGAGSVGHIFALDFARRAGVELTHVPYRGSAPMQADLQGGSIPLAFDALPQNVVAIRDGRVRALAVSSPERQPMAPEVPTTAEGGFPGLTAENWLGLSGPRGMPPALVGRLHAEAMAALDTPALTERLAQLGIARRRMTQPEFAAFVAQEVATTGAAIRALGLSPQQ